MDNTGVFSERQGGTAPTPVYYILITDPANRRDTKVLATVFGDVESAIQIVQSISTSLRPRLATLTGAVKESKTAFGGIASFTYNVGTEDA